MRSGRLSGSFLFQGHRDGRIRRQPHLLPFDIGDQPEIDEVMMPLVTSFAAVGPGEPDPAVFDAIDGSDVNAIRADHFHMLLYDRRLAPNEFIALPAQEFELSFLVGDTLRRPLLVRST